MLPPVSNCLPSIIRLCYENSQLMLGPPHLGDDDRANQLNVEYLRTSLLAHVCGDRRMYGEKSSQL